MPELLKVLLIDDNPDDRILVIRELKKLFVIDVEEIIDSREFERSLNRLDFDIVITDYQLRWTTGIEVLIKIKTVNPLLPVIMFTGTGSEEIAVMAMKIGLDDYILKSPQHYVRLAISVNSAILRMKDELLRKQTEIALRKSEVNYRTLVENIEIGFTRIDKDFNIIMVNEAQSKLFGLPAEDFIGKKCYSFYNQTHLHCPCVGNFKHETVISSKETLTQGYRKDHTVFEAHLRTFPTFYENGDVSGYIEITEDISGKIRSERMQEVSYNIANTLLESDDLSGLIVGIKSELSKVVDTTDLRVILWDEIDECFKTIYGDNSRDALFRKESRTLEGLVIHSQNALLVNQLEISEMLEKQIIDESKPGVKVWIGIPLKGEGKIIGVLVLQSDESETALSVSDLDILKFVSNQIGIAIDNRRVIDKLKESELRFRSIIEQLADGVVMVDNAGIITEWNHSVSQMLKISREDAIGKRVWDIHNELINHNDNEAKEILTSDEMYFSRLSILKAYESFVKDYRFFLKGGISKDFRITFFLTIINSKEYITAFLREMNEG
ncbi:MAG: PAS domain S-box protein [Bacteroidales bacterium]|nr:PAS domain S-box protein [Bacteroidales bacterium]